MLKRREIARTLLASATGSILAPKSADPQAAVGAAHPQTAAEISAGVLPRNLAFPELNILRYGAPINGGDAAPAMQSALSVLSKHAGGEMLIPAGCSFNVSQVVFQSLSNFNVRCDGVINSLVDQFGTPFIDQRRSFQGVHTPLKFIACDHFKIIGTGYIQPGFAEPLYINGCHDFEISIDCRGTGANSTLSGIYIQYCHQFILRDMVVDSITAQRMNDNTEVYYSWLNNIQLLDSYDFRISGWLSRRSGMNGIYVGSNCYDFDVSNNISEYNAGSGIQITWSGYGDMPVRYKINNNIFRFNQADGLDNPNTNGKGTVDVFAQFNNNLHVCNGWINCNPVNLPGADGSGLGTFYRIANFEAVGNVVFECASWGIFCDGCQDFSITANRVQKTRPRASNGGMYISALKDGRFIANDVKVAPGSPAFLMHTCDDVSIVDCSFSGLAEIANGAYTGCKISRCKFDCGNALIVQFDLSDCDVVVGNAGQDGLYVSRERVTLSGNRVTAPGNAIVISSANFCTLTNNVATSTGRGAGIYVTGATGTSIRGNRGTAVSGPGICVTGASRQTELAMNQGSSSSGNSFLVDASSTQSIKFGNVTVAGVANFAGGYDVNF